jgi:2-polyprenyl-6-methoxyphenol hydroxylase-like FAD-dependent oxidoreductase
MNTGRLEIIGGGLAGLSLGLALRRVGIDVTVFEAGEYPRHRVCGEFITGLDDDTIERLGLEPILTGALLHQEVAWFVGDEPPRLHALPHPAYGVSRYALDARLADAFTAAGGELRTKARVTDLSARPGRIFAIGRRRGHSPWIGLKTHVRGMTLHRDLELHLGNDAYVGLSRVEDGSINVCGLFRRLTKVAADFPVGDPVSQIKISFTPNSAPSSRTYAPHSNAQSYATLFGYLRACGFTALADRLQDAEIDASSFCSVAALQFDRRVPTTDRIQLGDACAMIPPFTGNGMAIAFQSAATALDPLRRYAHGEIAWPEACRITNVGLKKRFRVRLASADLLHPFLLRRNRQRALAALSRTGTLPFRPLYALLH